MPTTPQTTQRWVLRTKKADIYYSDNSFSTVRFDAVEKSD